MTVDQQMLLRPAELDEAWESYQAWVQVAMSDSWDEED
jgi:hypothetical protein